MTTTPAQQHKPVLIWLLTLCVLIFAMVIVGGGTRLTESGLSIVEWKPILGAIPPLNEHDWIAAFEHYKQFPQYQKVNAEMSLSEFKYIYYWEYFHRLLGRWIGLVFFIPFVVFLVQRKLSQKMKHRLFLAFLLGAAQGFLGWYMVQSGLIDNPRVSHYRLAAHLSLAFFLFSYLLWIFLDIFHYGWMTQNQNQNQSSAPALNMAEVKNNQWLLLRPVTILLLGLLVVQIQFGAFTAGLRAGYGYNTFPKMGDSWLPAQMWSLEPLHLNLFENPGTVQFVHRCLAWLLLFLISLFWLWVRRLPLSRWQRNIAHLVLGLVYLQFLLGVLTLLWVVPVSLGVMHQGVALLVLGSLVAFLHSLKKPVT